MFCDPQLGKRELYPTLSFKSTYLQSCDILDLISFSDGNYSLLEIADKLDKNFFELEEISKILLGNNLLLAC